MTTFDRPALADAQRPAGPLPDPRPDLLAGALRLAGHLVAAEPVNPDDAAVRDFLLGSFTVLVDGRDEREVDALLAAADVPPSTRPRLAAAMVHAATTGREGR